MEAKENAASALNNLAAGSEVIQVGIFCMVQFWQCIIQVVFAVVSQELTTQDGILPILIAFLYLSFWRGGPTASDYCRIFQMRNAFMC